MSDALRAEWTKQRTTPASRWLLLSSITLIIGMGAVAALSTSYKTTGSGQDITKLSLVGILLGQAIIAILAVQAISDEYGTGMIRVTLTAMPRRPLMLAAKAAILTALVLVAGTIAVSGSLLAGRLILPANGFTAAHGYPLLSLSHGPTLRAAVGSVMYLVLIALFSLGIATAVRESAGATGAALGLLYLFPIIAHVVGDPSFQRHVEQIAPMTAGLAIQSTTNLHKPPIAPWTGLAVMAAWATASLLTGGLLLQRRRVNHPAEPHGG
jgi:ABC-2 type transport system permease protein